MSERRLLLASGAYIDLSEYLLKSEAETLYAPLDAILNKQDKLISGTNIKTINNENILGSGNITISLTESDIATMGFTKNTGTYSKPSGGIPKSDLASAVQTSLGKADTALQSYTEQYKGTVTGVKINGTTKNPTSGVVDLGTVITAHQDIRGKQDKLVSGTNIKTINGTSILGSGDIVISGGGGSSSGGAGVYLTSFAVEQFCTGLVELTDEQRDELLNAASQNRVIGMPYSGSYRTGYVVSDYVYSFGESEDTWSLILGVIYNGAYYDNIIASFSDSNKFSPSRATIIPFTPLIYYVNAEDGVAYIEDDYSNTDNCIFQVEGECTELYIYIEPSNIGKTVRFFTGESCALEISAYVFWANGEVPIIEPYTHYELSLVANMEGAFNAVLTPFKPVE